MLAELFGSLYLRATGNSSYGAGWGVRSVEQKTMREAVECWFSEEEEPCGLRL